MTPQLHSGDLFAVSSKGFLGWAIRAVQCVWSWDSEAPYNHVGIITNGQGDTIEARWRFERFSINDYRGHRVLIVRHKEMTKYKALLGLGAIWPDLGNWYPVHRIALFMVPPLAKISVFNRGVCSEQTAKFMKGAGFGNVVYGITPDNLADLWRESKSMDIIFEGVWE